MEKIYTGTRMLWSTKQQFVTIPHCKQFWIYLFPLKNQPKLVPKWHKYIFPKSFAVGLWTNIIPKGTMKTAFEPGLLTMPLRKNIKLYLMELNSSMRIYSFFIKLIVKGAQAWAFFTRVFCTKQTIWVCDLGTEPKNPFF